MTRFLWPILLGELSVTPTPTPTVSPATDVLATWKIQVALLAALGVAVVALSIFGLVQTFRKKSQDAAATDAAFRNRVAAYVLNSSIWGLLVLAILTILIPSANSSERVFNALLPVFGTWVGTLLAFYFSKENFEAASRAVSELAKSVSGGDRLQSVPAKDVMIKPDQIDTLPAGCLGKKVGKEEDQIILADVVEHLKGVKKDRLPLFKDSQETYQKNGMPAGVVHLSTIEKFISDHNLQAAGGTKQTAKLSLKDLITADKFKVIFENSYGLIAEDATLGRAKAVIDNFSQKIPKDIKSGCYDVFVTKTGDGKETVIGWITNDIINENAKV